MVSTALELPEEEEEAAEEEEEAVDAEQQFKVTRMMATRRIIRRLVLHHDRSTLRSLWYTLKTRDRI